MLQSKTQNDENQNQEVIGGLENRKGVIFGCEAFFQYISGLKSRGEHLPAIIVLKMELEDTYDSIKKEKLKWFTQLKDVIENMARSLHLDHNSINPLISVPAYHNKEAVSLEVTQKIRSLLLTFRQAMPKILEIEQCCSLNEDDWVNLILQEAIHQYLDADEKTNNISAQWESVLDWFITSYVREYVRIHLTIEAEKYKAERRISTAAVLLKDDHIQLIKKSKKNSKDAVFKSFINYVKNGYLEKDIQEDMNASAASDTCKSFQKVISKYGSDKRIRNSFNKYLNDFFHEVVGVLWEDHRPYEAGDSILFKITCKHS